MRRYVVTLATSTILAMSAPAMAQESETAAFRVELPRISGKSYAERFIASNQVEAVERVASKGPEQADAPSQALLQPISASASR